VNSHKHGDRLSLLSARPAVTFPATERHYPLASTKLYCLVTKAHVCVNNLPDWNQTSCHDLTITSLHQLFSYEELYSCESFREEKVIQFCKDLVVIYMYSVALYCINIA